MGGGGGREERLPGRRNRKHKTLHGEPRCVRDTQRGEKMRSEQKWPDHSGLQGHRAGFELCSEWDKSKLRAFKCGQALLSTDEDKGRSEEAVSRQKTSSGFGDRGCGRSDRRSYVWEMLGRQSQHHRPAAWHVV